MERASPGERRPGVAPGAQLTLGCATPHHITPLTGAVQVQLKPPNSVPGAIPYHNTSDLSYCAGEASYAKKVKNGQVDGHRLVTQDLPCLYGDEYSLLSQISDKVFFLTTRVTDKPRFPLAMRDGRQDGVEPPDCDFRTAGQGTARSEVHPPKQSAHR